MCSDQLRLLMHAVRKTALKPLQVSLTPMPEQRPSGSVPRLGRVSAAV